MSEQVDAATLLDAVAAFLGEIEPALAGQQGFHAKVAANALAIVARELRQRPAVVQAEALGEFLGRDAPLDALLGELCAGLRSGAIAPEQPGLLDALTTATLARLAVDNPRYSTFRRMTDSPGGDGAASLPR